MRALSLAAILTLGFLTTLPALAQTTFVVTKTADTNDGTCDADCSLREAIEAAEAAAGDDLIRFDPALDGQSIFPTSGYTINTNVEIDAVTGLSQGITIDAGLQFFAVFQVFPLSGPPNTVSLAGLTLTRSQNGALFNDGILTVDQCTIRDNTAGAIQNEGTLVVKNSTLSGNAATTIDRSTLFNQSGDVTVLNSTFSGNTTSSTSVAAAIQSNPSGTVTVRNSTFSGNTHTLGQVSGILGGTVTVGNTVFDSGGGANLGLGTIISEGFNICDDACGLTGTGDQTSTDPQLGPLADNGGPTLTHSLLMGSPAIDIGGTCGPEDQRGESAPVAGTFGGSATCDAGAVEIATPPPPTTLVVNTLDGGNDGTCGTDGADPIQDCSLLEAVAAANSNPDATEITFSVDGDVSPTSGVVISTPVTLDGTTAPSGAHSVRILGTGLTITGASAANSVIEGLVIGSAPVFAVRLEASVTGVQVRNNFIGTDPTGADLRNGDVLTATGSGIVIGDGASDNTIGGSTLGEGNTMGFTRESIVLQDAGTTRNAILGNFVGTSAAGANLATTENGQGLSLVGVAIRAGASGNTIGGSSAGAANTFGFLRATGIIIEDAGTTGNIVLGNFLGTDATGANLGNTFGQGIDIRNAASDNTIGGTGAGEGNTIGFSRGSGVVIQFAGTTGNTVLGNFIGTNAAGANLGNRRGVFIASGAANNVVGGSAAGAANTIGFSAEEGVRLQNEGTSGNHILGNYIGTNANGDDLGNGFHGVNMLVGPSNNTIGGTGAGEGNVIGFNDFEGIQMGNSGASPTGNVIAGNFIGTDASGANLGNGRNGIALGGGVNTNTFGGTDPGAGNTIGFNGAHGIRINNNNTVFSASVGNVIRGNFVGTNAAGADLGNGADGILLDKGAQSTTVGGVESGAGNTVGFNGGSGIVLANAGTSSNTVLGNFLGTNASGANLGNTLHGILVQQTASDNTIGGATTGAANTIGFNGFNGIRIIGSGTTGNTVLGNYIGTNAGSANLGNGDQGVYIVSGAADNTIGGANAGEGNTIGFNGREGVLLAFAGTSGNEVLGNYIGTNANGDDLGNDQGVEVSVGASGNTVGGANAGEGNTIGFNEQGGVVLKDAGTSGNEVLGNYIGTNANGDNLGNPQNGILIENRASVNTIGGTAMGAANTVGFNGGSGIVLTNASTSANTVVGNFVGTNASGANLGNTTHGILITAGAASNTIGGANAGEGNTIGFNVVDGIVLRDANTSENTVLGNFIGTNAAGADLGNARRGITFSSGASTNTIGGAAPGEGNTIGFNTTGIYIQSAGTVGNVIQGNFIGTDAAGVSLGNLSNGIFLGFEATDTVIGGSSPGEGNTIGFNGRRGISFQGAGTSGNSVQGNYIGTNAAGDDLGNGQHGVSFIAGANDNLIGGPETGDGNTIAFNDTSGVFIAAPGTTGNAVLSNAMYENGELGIDLVETSDSPRGVTPNDGCDDADVGPNGFQNFPVLAQALASGGTTTIDYDLDTAAGTYRVEFFSVTAPDPSGNGEGRTFLGAQDVTVSAGCGETFQFVLPTQLATSLSITATATSVTTGTTPTFGGTSEFSAAVAVSLPVGTIGDFVFNDRNGDGVQDAGEGGLEGITVFLDANDNGELDAGEQSDAADASGSYDITDVVAGTYTVKVDTTTVPEGFVLTTGNDPVMVELAAGQDFNDADFGFRFECAPGFFLDPDDPMNCLPAPPGTFVASAGATEATDCLPGTFQPLEGQTSCDLAPAGRFVEVARATETEVCPLGKYQPLEGQTSCLPADPGNFVPVEEAIVQSPCELGTFQPEAGQAMCLPAPVGSYVDMEEATSATSCPAGTTTSGEGATSASDCVAIEVQTFIVTKTADTNDGTCDADCSLREAIAAADANLAAAADTITFSPAVTGTIALDGTQLTLVTDVVINGPGAGVLAVSGNQISRVFETTSTVEINDLTIRDGNATSSGSGIRNLGGTLTIRRSSITNNGGQSGIEEGGGLFSENGVLTLEHTTVSGNSNRGRGAGLYVSSGIARIHASTFSGNDSRFSSGVAIYAFDATVTIENSTIVSNVVTSGTTGGIISQVGTITFANTIIVGNNGFTGFEDCEAFDGGTITSLGHNVVGIGTGCPFDGAGDVKVAAADAFTTALDATLADNGGPTLTHALLPGSPAIDIGGTCGPTDQRGFDAPIIGLASNSTALCDAGSFETEILDAEPPTVVIATTLDDPTATQPIPLTFTFSEVVSGFAADDIDVTGGTLGDVTTADSTTFAADLMPDGAGTLTVDIDAGVASDLAGNPNEAADTFSITFDNEGPAGYTVAFDQSAVNAPNETAVSFTISDAELGATFAYTITSDGGAGEVTGSGTVGGAAPRLRGSGDILSEQRGNKGGGFLLALPSTLTGEQVTGIDVSELPDGTLTLTVTLTDPLGNEGNEATNTVIKDTVAPTVVVATTASDPTSTKPIPVTFTFSEPMTGFEAADVTVTGGTLGTLTTSDNTTFTGAVDPDGSGEISVAVPVDVATDAASNGNAASNTFTIEFDGDAPVLTITTIAPEPTVQSPFSVTFTFSEAVSGFDASDVDVTNATLSAFAGVGDTYTALVTPTDFGVVTVTVEAGAATDTAGNGNTADTLTRTFEERFDIALATEFVFTGPGTGTLTAIVTNTGSVPATRVRVKITKTFDVATGPKQIVIGAIAPGETGTAVFDFGSAGADAEVRLKVDDLVVRRGEPDRTNNDAVVFLVPSDGGADTVAPEITGALSGQLFAGTVEENRIDDTGVASVALDPGAVNLTLTVDPFTAGATVVSYTATPIDPMQDASGTIRATDVAGNPATRAISIPRTPPPPPTETLVVRLTPDNAPIFIGIGGGSFTFTGEVTNPTSGRLAQDVWLVLISPSGAEEVQFGPFRVRLDAGGMTAEMFTVTVDREAEAGVYTYEGRVGDFPGVVTDTDTFTFEKLGASTREGDPLTAALGSSRGAANRTSGGSSARAVLPVLSTAAGLLWDITDDAEWAALLDDDVASAHEPGTASDDLADGRSDADDQAAPHEPAEDGAFDAKDQQGEAAPADGERNSGTPEPASDEQTASQTADRDRAERTQPDEDTLDTVGGTADDTQATRDANKQGDQPATAKDGALASANGAPVARSQALPTDYALAAPYPNPLTQAHTATIRLALPEASDVEIAVYDLRGRIVTTLASGAYEAGHHDFALDARTLASGTYVVRVIAEGYAATEKVTVLR
ncbi:MAG: Ig-like domain-containing protein [Bacteroidota bacterium]